MFFFSFGLKRENKKKNLKKSNRERKLIRILKKPTGLIQFWFYKPEKKTDPNSNRKKNLAKPNKTGTGQFEPVFVLK
jgi:hypothetical protein